MVEKNSWFYVVVTARYQYVTITVSSRIYAQSVSSEIRMKVGDEHYCEPWFTLSDDKFKNDF